MKRKIVEELKQRFTNYVQTFQSDDSETPLIEAWELGPSLSWYLLGNRLHLLVDGQYEDRRRSYLTGEKGPDHNNIYNLRLMATWFF